MLSPADAEDVLKAEIFFKLPNDYRVASGALTNGVPVAEFEPGVEARRGRITQLAAKLGGGVSRRRRTALPTRTARAASRLKKLFARKRS